MNVVVQIHSHTAVLLKLFACCCLFFLWPTITTILLPQGGVSKVRIRPDKIGGSAFETKTVLFGRRLFSKRKGQLTDVGQDHAYALKSIIIDRTSNNEYVEELQNEIAILRTLDHPNVVRLHEVYTHKKQIYLVLELCEGGDLAARSPYSEKEAARIASQIVSAVSYLHLNGVVHRDLKVR